MSALLVLLAIVFCSSCHGLLHLHLGGMFAVTGQTRDGRSVLWCCKKALEIIYQKQMLLNDYQFVLHEQDSKVSLIAPPPHQFSTAENKVNKYKFGCTRHCNTGIGL
jgi:hypothetical protein